MRRFLFRVTRARRRRRAHGRKALALTKVNRQNVEGNLDAGKSDLGFRKIPTTKETAWVLYHPVIALRLIYECIRTHIPVILSHFFAPTSTRLVTNTIQTFSVRVRSTPPRDVTIRKFSLDLCGSLACGGMENLHLKHDINTAQ